MFENSGEEFSIICFLVGELSSSEKLPVLRLSGEDDTVAAAVCGRTGVRRALAVEMFCMAVLEMSLEMESEIEPAVCGACWSFTRSPARKSFSFSWRVIFASSPLWMIFCAISVLSLADALIGEGCRAICGCSVEGGTISFWLWDCGTACRLIGVSDDLWDRCFTAES